MSGATATQVVQTCDSRMRQFGPWKHEPNLDTWNTLPNGDRVCSFCGSLHPDDFHAIVLAANADDSTTSVEPSDKAYKVYVSRPGIANASQGGIKFYTWHLSGLAAADLTTLNAIWNSVLSKSARRWQLPGPVEPQSPTT